MVGIWRELVDENVRRTNVNTFVCKLGDHTVLLASKATNAKGWLVCAECHKEYQKEYREKRKEKTRLDNKEYRTANKAAIKEQRAGYRAANKEKIAASAKINWDINGAKYSAKGYKRKVERLKTDIAFKLQETIRSRITMAIKGSVKRGSAIKLLGCSIEDFKVYIEKQFEPGMTWDNWSLKGWHLDHIKPIKDFDLSDAAQLAEVCHYTNMRPLWAKANLARRFE